MSQQDQHLTTEQLSTWIDEQLIAEEQAYCSAHLEECEQCQSTLDKLQQTVNLLRSLPQLEVPRSFALPTDFKVAADGNKQFEQPPVTSPRRLPTPLRRTLRTVSALAAVIGLFFALSGIVAQPHPDVTSTSSMSAPTITKFPTSSQYRQAPQVTNDNSNNISSGSSNPPNKADDKQQTPPAETNPTATWSILPFLDLNQPGERLSLGIPLVILGTIGFISFAQRQKHRTRAVKRNL